MYVHSVVTAFFASLYDVVFVRCDGADLLGAMPPLGRGLEGQVLLYGVAVYPEGPGIWAFFMPFFESVWMEWKSLCACSLVRSLAALRPRRRFVSLWKCTAGVGTRSRTSVCCLNTRRTTSLKFFRRWKRSATCTA